MYRLAVYFFCHLGQIHSWELSDDTDGYIFFFSQEYYNMHYVNQKLKNFPFFSSVSFPRKLQLDNQNLQKIDSLFTELQEESLEENLMQKENILGSYYENLYSVCKIILKRPAITESS